MSPHRFFSLLLIRSRSPLSGSPTLSDISDREALKWIKKFHTPAFPSFPAPIPAFLFPCARTPVRLHPNKLALLPTVIQSSQLRLFRFGNITYTGSNSLKPLFSSRRARRFLPRGSVAPAAFLLHYFILLLGESKILLLFLRSVIQP